MRRRLVFLAPASLAAVLATALVYFSAGADLPSPPSLPLGRPAQHLAIAHVASFYGAVPGGATSTPTPCSGGLPGAWAVRSPLPIDAFGVMVAGDGTYAYAFGGYRYSVPGATNQVFRYDPVADTWVSLAAIPAVTYDGAAVYGSNGNIYVFGGTDATNVYNTTRIYNIAAGTWSTGAPMLGNRQEMGAGYYNGKIYIVGGYDSTSVSPQSQTWEYTIASNTWAARADMPQALGGPGSGVVAGHLYVAGGRDSTNGARNTLYDYDAVAGSWSVRANLPTGVNVPGAGVVGGRLVVFGGGNPFLARTKDEGHPAFPANVSPFTTASTQLYDPVANTWSILSNLNVARSFVGGAAVGQYLVAVGGYDGTTSVNTNEVSGPAPCGTGTPTPLTNTPTRTTPPTTTPTGPTRTDTATNTPTGTNTQVSTNTVTPTNTGSITPSNTPSLTPTSTRTNTPSPTQTTGGITATPAQSNTRTPSNTPGSTNTPGGPTATPTATPTTCPIQFTDVPEGSTFYEFIRCLACRGIVSGYTTSPPCSTGTPCFAPGNSVTRGQMAKFVSNSAGYTDPIPPGQQTFTDVPPSSTFWLYIERVNLHGVAGGYNTSPPCTTGTPCFLPGNSVTRGQTAKFVSNAASYVDPIPPGQQTFTDVPPSSTFWVYTERVYLHNVISGYNTSPPCTTGIPCYLSGISSTRGQMSKFIANAFLPDCSTPFR